MISAEFLYNTLQAQDITFYAGVPDSLLKNLCAYITDHAEPGQHVIAANEGGAVALAAGYHLATGKVGVVYMQNSGEGNTINPLASLTDKEVYRIPMLLLIGWRGKPGVHDEPQHVKQGKITTGLLNVMGVNYAVLAQEEEKAAAQIAKAIEAVTMQREVYALVIEKDTFEPYVLQTTSNNAFAMTREEAIQTVAAAMGERDCAVSTTGMISRELYEYRTAQGQGHERDFLTVGSMGHASQIALGIAMQQPDRRVWCFDGDGASIMHMGNMAILAVQHPRNMVHVVFNNGAHDSVGGQPTVGLQINLTAIAQAMGYAAVRRVVTAEELQAACQELAYRTDGPVFLEVCVRKGNRKDLGRPKTTPIKNKKRFMEFLQQ